jgi:transposase
MAQAAHQKASNSPDLNTIENVWSWLKRQLKETHPTNLEELNTEIRKLWCMEE